MRKIVTLPSILACLVFSQNEVQNHSFESGDGTSWTTGNSWAVVNDTSSHGTFSMKMWGLGYNQWNGNWNVVHQDWNGVEPGDVITMQGKIMSLSSDSVSGGNNAWLEFEFLDASGTSLGESFNVGSKHYHNSDPLDVWVPLSISAVVPEGAATARAKLVYFQDDSTDGSGTFYPGSVYFDDIHVEYNYLSNPGFEDGAVSWNWTNANQAVITDTAFGGTKSTKNWGGYYNAWEGNWTTTEQWINTQAMEGDVVRLSGYMMSPSTDSIRGGSYAYLEVTFYRADSSHLGNDTNQGSGQLNDNSPLDQWHYFSVETPVPADAQIAKANLVYRQSSPDGGATYEAGAVFFDEISFACDGCTSDTTVVEVTIQIDMQNETVSSEGPHIGGGTWGDQRIALTDNDGDDVYDVSLFLKKDSTYVYTFLNGTCGDYSCKENISGQSCAYGQYSDRSFTVGQSDTTMPAYCFSSCEVCPSADSVAVTFQVDMRNETVSSEGVHIGGGSWGSDRIPLADADGDGVWSTTLTLASDSNYVFVYLNGTCSDYSCKEDLSGDPCAYGQYNDREIQVGVEDITLLPVLFGSCSPADLIINNFENDSLASSSLSNSFWTYFDETDTLANYVTLTPLDSVNSLGGGSGAMLMEYNITKYANWGGFGAIYHIYDSPIDMSNYNQLSFRVNNTLAAALSQAIEIRVALYDGSDATTEYLNPATATTEPRDFVENWYTFFKNPRFVDGESGWNEIRIPLAQSNESNPNYRDGFGSGPGDVGIAGNNVMDLDHIVGIAIEVVLYDENPDVDITTGQGVYGEFIMDDLKAILSFDVPGCTDVNACNYNPDATLDDGSCYECAEVTWKVDFSSVAGDLPTAPAIGGGNAGNPSNPENAMQPVEGEPGIFTVTRSIQQNTTFIYTILTSGCDDYGCKENIGGQDCAVAPWNDRSVTVGTADTTIMTCFGSCTENEYCPNIQYDVTFNVNMMDQDVDPNGIYLAGGIIGQDGHLMSDPDGDDIYSVTLPFAPGTQVTYKFRNRPSYGDWGGFEDANSIAACGTGEYNDRFFTVGDADTSLEAVCYGKCYDCPPSHPVDVTFVVDMNNVDGFDGSAAPYVFGSFNDWNNFGTQTMLTDDNGDNVYSGTVEGLMSRDSITALIGFGSVYESVPDTCGIYDSNLLGNVREVPVFLADTASVLHLDTISYGGCPFDYMLSNDGSLKDMVPTVFSYKTYPNPFNPYINIYYELPTNELVSITIVNLLGQKMRTLVNEIQVPGRYQYKWDGKDSFGKTLQSGIYFAVINRESGTDISKITFLK